MPFIAYFSQDPVRYKRHESSRVFSSSLPSGNYVYVQDCEGVIWVAVDGPHMHPRVLVGARPAVGAGELVLEESGEIVSINNESGTYRCHPDSLLTVVGGLLMQGATIDPDAVHHEV